MRKKNTEIRLTSAGINADDSFQLIGDNELVNALNVTPFSPYEQIEGSNNSTLAPQSLTSVQAILNADTGINTLLGYCTDVSNLQLYLFYHNTDGFHKIISTNGAGAILHLNDADVIDGLNWSADMFISARIFGNLLFFTDNVNPQRYINVNKSYSTGSLTQSMITLGQEPFSAPLKVARATDSAVYSNFVQLNAFQMTYRVQNDEGFLSVLSPYSETVAPVRQSDLTLVSQNFGNTIVSELNFDMKIPSDWKRFDFIVRNLADNTFLIYRSLFSSNTADAAEVAAHNAGTTALKAIFTGNTTEAIDSISASKQFESIPRTSKLLEIALSRISLANNLEGYNAPTTLPANVSITKNTVTASNITWEGGAVYLVLAKNFDIDDAEFPIYGGLFTTLYDTDAAKWKVYSLPYEYSKLRFNGSTTLYLDTRTSFPYLPPQTISKDALIEIPTAFEGTFISTLGVDPFLALETLSAAYPALNGFSITDLGGFCYNEALARLVWTVHGIGDLVGTGGTVSSGNWYAVNTNTAGTIQGYIGLSRFNCWGGLGSDDYYILVSNAPSEKVGTDSRFFFPSTNYSTGIRFYDSLLRTCGNVFKEKITTPSYNPVDRTLVKNIDVSLSGVTGGAPSWAKYFAFTMSKNESCNDFLMFSPNCIKVARQKNNGEIYVTSDLQNNFLNDKIYGIAIPLDSLGQYHKGYAFDPTTSINDRVTLEFGFQSPDALAAPISYTANVINFIDGHVIIAPFESDPLGTTFYGAYLPKMFSTQYKQIASPTFNVTLGATISNHVAFSGQYRERQHLCYATILIGNQPDIDCYEVAAIGYCEDLGAGNQPSKFYTGTGVATSITINGDCYSQKRESRIFGFTGLSTTSNETIQSFKWVENSGRISPIDKVGERYLPNAIRWSNTGILGAFDNNLSKFDVLDYRLTDSRAGEINMLWSQLGDTERSNAMLIICKSNGYYAMLGQNVLYNSNGEANLTVSNNYIDNLQELNGRPGTESPRSFAGYNGVVMWVDTVQRCVQLYQSGNTFVASDIKVKRVFERILKQVVENDLQSQVTGGINPLSGEYLVSIPTATPSSKPNLPTSNVEFPFDFYYNKNFTWVFNYNIKRWTSIFTTGRWYMNVAKNVYSWNKQTVEGLSEFYKEFTLSDDAPEYDGMICIPFNSEYPKVKSPLAISLDASRAPDETWVFASTNGNVDSSIEDTYSVMVANVGDWIYREGQWQCSILRNRLSNNAANATQYNQSGINGFRLKGKVIQIAMIWYSGQGKFNVTSVQLNYT